MTAGPLVRDSSGELYGVDPYGGPNSDGSVFRVDPNTHSVTTLAVFGATGGAYPTQIALDGQGNIFGITRSSDTGASGTLFRLPAAEGATITPIYDFIPGDYPTSLSISSGTVYCATFGAPFFIYDFGNGYGGPLVNTPEWLIGGENNLNVIGGQIYGTTFDGGNKPADNNGTLFDSIYYPSQILFHSFPITVFDGKTIGDHPLGAPLVSTGADTFAFFEGTLSSGGPLGLGGVYAVSNNPANSTPAFFPLTDATVGTPIGNLVIDSAGNIFGTTASSDGTAGSVFEVPSATKKLQVVAKFSDDSPQPGLAIDSSGNVFGATAGKGIVFELSPAINLVPSPAKTSLPTAIATGIKLKGKVAVSIKNTTTGAFNGVQTLSVYATSDAQVDSGSILLGTNRRRISLKVGESTTLTVGVKHIALPNGNYATIAQVTDLSGAVVATATGAPLTIAAPFTDVSPVVGSVVPAVVVAGKTASFKLTITNAGNIDAIGPATLDIGLSTDGATLAVPIVTRRLRSLRIKAGGKPSAVTTHFKIPRAGVASGNYFAFVTLKQGLTSVQSVRTIAFSVIG